MHEYTNYTILSQEDIDEEKDFLSKHNATIVDNKELEIIRRESGFQNEDISTYGAFFKYSPSLTKAEEENLEYWDQDGNCRSESGEMIYYQEGPVEVHADNVIVDTMCENFSLDELISLFKGEVTRLSTKDAKINNGPAAHNGFMKDQHVYLDLIRGNDPYFTQKMIGKFKNIYKDAVYILWDREPFNVFTLSPKYKFDDKNRRINIFVFNEYEYIEDHDEFLEFIKSNYPYKLEMLGQGAMVTINGLDKAVASMSDDECIIVKLATDDDDDVESIFMTTVEDIKHSPTGGRSISFIWHHDEDGEDYGYYY